MVRPVYSYTVEPWGTIGVCLQLHVDGVQIEQRKLSGGRSLAERCYTWTNAEDQGRRWMRRQQVQHEPHGPEFSNRQLRRMARALMQHLAEIDEEQ